MTESQLVYIAGPYTEGAWEDNLRNVIDVAEYVWSRGHTPFIPHTMTTLWALVYQKEKEKWLEFDLRWLDVCDAMIRVDGHSPGAAAEQRHCEENDIPVFTNKHEFVRWARDQ